MEFIFESWQHSSRQQQRRGAIGEDGIYGILSGIFLDVTGQASARAHQGNPMFPQGAEAQQRQPHNHAAIPKSPPPQLLINTKEALPQDEGAESFYDLFTKLFSHDDAPQDAAPKGVVGTQPLAASPKPPTAQWAEATPQVYAADPNDLLDQHVEYQLRQIPDAHKSLKVTRKTTGVYELNGCEFQVEWKYAEQPGEMGHLVCVAGLQRQPFSDYIQKMASNNSNHGIPFGSSGALSQHQQHATQSVSGVQAQSTAMRHVESSQRHARSCPLASARGSATSQTSTLSIDDSPMAGMRSVTASTSSMNGQQHLPTGNQQAAMGTQSVLEKDDLIDQHVKYALSQAVGTQKWLKAARKHPGVYEIGGREVHVEWEHAARPGAQGRLVVIDGPMRQPFLDYLNKSEDNVEYESAGLERSALEKMPLNTRLTFEEHQVDNRLDAMKLAKAQAQFREKAADYVTKGQEVPADFMEKYNKTLQQKLGTPVGSKQRFRPPATPQAGPRPLGAMPCAATGATASAMAPMQMVPPAMSPPMGQLSAAMLPGALAPMLPTTATPSQGTPAVGPMLGHSSPTNVAWPVGVAGVPYTLGSATGPPQWPQAVAA